MEPVETVKRIIHMPAWQIPAHYQELRAVLRALDVASLRALLADGLAEYDRMVQQSEAPEPWLYGPDNAGMELALWIAQVRPDACDGLPADLWRRRALGHGVLYRGADAAIRDAILAEADALLDTLIEAFPDLVASSLKWGDPAIRDRQGELTQRGEWNDLNSMLRMLAWIGDEAVRRWFQIRRRIWGALFYLSADAIISEGGWELTSDGARRDLTFPIAYQLLDADSANADGDSSGGPVAVMTPYNGHCRWCGRRLTALFDLDLRHPALAFIGLDGTRLCLVICEECSLWNRLYMDVDLFGGAHWNARNESDGGVSPEDDSTMYFTPPDHRLALGPRCASPTEVAARGADWDVSQLGGMPAWIQSAEYPSCPICQHKMLFIGEVALETVTDRAVDGVFYGFFCPTNLLTTAIYQCT